MVFQPAFALNIEHGGILKGVSPVNGDWKGAVSPRCLRNWGIQ